MNFKIRTSWGSCWKRRKTWTWKSKGSSIKKIWRKKSWRRRSLKIRQRSRRSRRTSWRSSSRLKFKFPTSPKKPRLKSLIIPAYLTSQKKLSSQTSKTSRAPSELKVWSTKNLNSTSSERTLRSKRKARNSPPKRRSANKNYSNRYPISMTTSKQPIDSCKCSRSGISKRRRKSSRGNVGRRTNY